MEVTKLRERVERHEFVESQEINRRAWERCVICGQPKDAEVHVPAEPPIVALIEVLQGAELELAEHDGYDLCEPLGIRVAINSLLAGLGVEPKDLEGEIGTAVDPVCVHRGRELKSVFAAAPATPSVEECLVELREMFPATYCEVRIHSDGHVRYDDGRVLSSSSCTIHVQRLKGNDKYFTGATPAEAMNAVRQWAKENQK